MAASIARHLGDVTDVAGFLAAINGALNGELEALFRGHRNAAWMLRPSNARQKRWLENTQSEMSMLDEFKRRALPYLESNYQLDDTDWLAIAQHHGMPTRLLDWSGSALTALWFAIAEPAAPGPDGVPTAAAVWALTYSADDLLREEERIGPFSIKRTALVKPRHVSRRIAAQDGWFTLHREHGDGRPSFVALETNRDYKDRLCYVTIPASAFGQIRMQLSQAGVTSAVLYPDLAGVASYVAWSHLYREDELVPRLIGPLNPA